MCRTCGKCGTFVRRVEWVPGVMCWSRGVIISGFLWDLSGCFFIRIMRYVEVCTGVRGSDVVSGIFAGPRR